MGEALPSFPRQANPYKSVILEHSPASKTRNFGGQGRRLRARGPLLLVVGDDVDGGASLKQGKNCWNTPQIFGILVRRNFFENRVFFAPNFKGFSSIYVNLRRFLCTLASIPRIVGEHSNLRQSFSLSQKFFFLH